MNTTVQIFIDIISLWHRYLKFTLSCLSTHVLLENFAKLAALCLIQDQVHLLWKKKMNKYIFPSLMVISTNLGCLGS